MIKAIRIMATMMIHTQQNLGPLYQQAPVLQEDPPNLLLDLGDEAIWSTDSLCLTDSLMVIEDIFLTETILFHRGPLHV